MASPVTQYTVYTITTESLEALHGPANWSTVYPSQGPEIESMREELASFQRLSVVDCLDFYAKPFLNDRSDVVLVVEPFDVEFHDTYDITRYRPQNLNDFNVTYQKRSGSDGIVYDPYAW